MKQKINFFVVLLAGMSLLVSCAEVKIRSVGEFQLSGRESLYKENNWSFAGRIALSDQKHSFSATINWKHKFGLDEIELSGPFGQGRTVIWLTENTVKINNGKQLIKHSGDVDKLVSEKLGVFVPVLALKYWVRGLTEPDQAFLLLKDGFKQRGWDVNYLQMQRTGDQIMPKKMKISSNVARLKLFIKQWTFG